MKMRGFSIYHIHSEVTLQVHHIDPDNVHTSCIRCMLLSTGASTVPAGPLYDAYQPSDKRCSLKQGTPW